VDKKAIMSTDKQRIIREIEATVGSKLSLLLNMESAWQPSDFLPSFETETVIEDVKQLRETARGLPDDLLVVLVGSMVTEEALPSYQVSFNKLEGIGDETGAGGNPWALWSRGWTAEENRHGDLLNRYLYLSGRVDMRAVEVTIHHLIRNGFAPGHSNDPYKGLIYTSFQERATRISHAKVGQLARNAGEFVLGKICNVIAGDEARHEEAYKCFAAEIFKLDPAGAIQAFDAMLTETIVMPARQMSDGGKVDVFASFSMVAQRLGVYTFTDYIDIIEHLIELWKIPHLTGLSGEAAEAQARVCRLPQYYRRRSAWMDKKVITQPAQPFRWLQNRVV
jgi:acyl-[acyl-carrier-protein] desaturase